MIHNLRTNGSGPSIAEQRAAEYRASSLPSQPTAARQRLQWGKAAPWLAAGLVTVAGLGAAYTLTPTVPSVAVRQVFVDVDGNGTLDLLLYGEVVLNSGPLAQPSPQP